MTLRRSAMLLLPLLGACAVTHHPSPLPEAPERWRTELNAAAAVVPDWWRVFADEALSNLLEQAALHNLDLAAADQRVAQARASLQQAHGQQWPVVTAGALGSKAEGKAEYGQLSLDASYTLDLWSADRARAFGTQADLDAAIASRAFTAWRLGTSVAQLYFERRALDERLALATDGLAAAQRTFQLTQERYRSGLVSGLDLALAETAIATEQANVIAVQQARDEAHNAMALLLGRAPAELEAWVGAEPSLLELELVPVPAALPAEVLARRPDIRIQEAQLRAADADITVARAKLFPSLTLSAGGLIVHGVAGMVAEASASLVQVVFDGGERRAGVRLAEARYAELLDNYRAGVLNALVEIENALARVKWLTEREGNDRVTLQAAQRAFQLSQIRYESGLESALTLLSSQSSFLRARDRLLQARSERVQALVALYAGMAGF